MRTPAPRVRLKYVCEGGGEYGLNIAASEYVDEGVRLIRTSDLAGGRLAEDGAIFVRPGAVSPGDLLQADDLLLSRSGTVGRAFLVPAEATGMAYAGFLVRFRTRSDVVPRFMYYCTQSDEFQSSVQAEAIASTIQNFNAERYNNLAIPRPPLDEQHAIADYLDRETGRIDTLIAEQQSLIELLRERRTAVVDATVWSGLESEVAHSPTGIDPAPLAPAHWQRVRNKNLFFESSVLSVTGEEELLTVSHLTGITPRSEKQNVNMIEAESLEGYRLVEAGDLVINTMWAWMGALGVSKISGIVSPAYGVYRPLPQIEMEHRFFDYLYRSQPYVIEMTRHSRGIWESRLRLYPESFLRLPVVVPPISEQRRIADYLDEQITKIDSLIAEAERFVELARERRSALITPAVTGQIAAREMA